MKKLIATFLSIVFAFNLFTPALAASDSNALKVDTISLNGETHTIRYKEENGSLVYAEADGTIIEKIGNEVYADGIKVATITRDVVESPNTPITPRSGWIRQTTCPYGSPSEYTRDWGIERVNIYLSDAIANLTAAALILAVAAAIGITFGEAWGQAFLDAIIYDFEWADSRYIYSLEHTWHHHTVPYIAKIDCTYYLDSARQNEVPNTAKTIYATWS